MDKNYVDWRFAQLECCKERRMAERIIVYDFLNANDFKLIGIRSNGEYI